MPLDPETLKAIQDAIKESLPVAVSEAIKPLAEQLEHQQNTGKKLTEAVTTLTTSVSQQDERFNTINTSLEQLKAKDTTPNSSDKPKNKDKSEPTDVEALRTSIDEIKKEYEGKLTGLQTQLDERDKETQQLREADRKNKMRGDALSAIRGLGTVRSNTEEDLLLLLESRGLLIEDGDRLYVKGPEKFGEVTKLEIKAFLPELLKNDFAHFAAPRGGTGTDATPGSRPTTSSQYNFENMTSQQVYDTYKDNPEAMKAYDGLLLQQLGKA